VGGDWQGPWLLTGVFPEGLRSVRSPEGSRPDTSDWRRLTGEQLFQPKKFYDFPYVSRQLGHKDASITLRVYAHWLPDAVAAKAVDLLDDTQPSATQTQPTMRSGEWKNALSAYGRMVSQDGIEPSTRRLRVCCSAN
jgi:hypothetical protein